MFGGSVGRRRAPGPGWVATPGSMCVFRAVGTCLLMVTGTLCVQATGEHELRSLP